MSKKKKQNKKNKRPYYDFSNQQGQTARGPVGSKDYAADYGHNPYDAYVSGDSVPPLVHRTRGGEHGRQGQQNVPQGLTGLRWGSMETSRQVPVRYGDYASSYSREYTGATAPYDQYVQLSQGAQQVQPAQAPMTYTGDYQGNAYDCYYGTGQDDGYCDWQFGQAGPAGPQGPGMFQEAPHRAPAYADPDYGANAYDCYYGTGGDDGYCAINYQGPTAQGSQQAQQAQPAQASAPAAGHPGGGQSQGQSRTFSLSREALQKVFDQAVADIDGLLALDGHMTTADAGQAGGQVDLSLQAVFAYGARGKEIFRALSDSLEAALQDQAGLSVHTCHVEVVDIMVREDFNSQYQSQAPDKQKDQRAEAKKAKDKE